ncbi:MAG: DUF2199 domain-containing protein [Lysobacterales bacterium]
MTAIFAFTCSCCGKVHEGSPSFGFRAPDPYTWLTEEQKASVASLSADFCTIEHDGETDRFVRAVLEVPIHGIAEPFLWGVWVSLSEQSFERYRSTYNDPVEGETFFGWVCNSIALYPYPKHRPSDVIVRSGRARPKVRLHRGDPEDDPLVIDQVSGISVLRAQHLAERAMHAA